MNGRGGLAAASRVLLAAALAGTTAVIVVRAIAHRTTRPTAGGASPVASSTVAPPPSPSAETPGRGVPKGAVRAGPPSMLHLDPHHTNRSPFVAPHAPKIAWTVDLGGPIAAAPVVVDGDVLVASLSGAIARIDASGAVLWRIETGERVYGSPLVDGAVAYVGRDKGKLLAVRAKDGGFRFQLDVDGDADTAPAPLPDGGIVFAAGRSVYAIRRDGTVRWRVKTKRKVFASPAVADDGTIVLGTQGDDVLALRPDGSTKWRVPAGADADAAPAIADDGTIYAGTDAGEVLALRPDDGTIAWRRDVGGYVRGPLSIGRDGVVFASTYGPVPSVVALAPKDGAIVWKLPIRGTGAKEFGIHGSPVEDAEGTLLFGGQDDFVVALDPTGHERWRVKAGGDVDATVVLAADGRLVFGCEDGKVYGVTE